MTEPGRGKIIYDRPVGLPGIDLMGVEQNSEYWRVFHEHYVLCACHTAAADWRYRNRDYRLVNHSLMLLEPGETHVNMRVFKPADFVVIWVPPNIMADAAYGMGAPAIPHFRKGQVSDSALYHATCGLQRSDPGNVLEQQFYFTQMLHTLLARHTEHPPHFPVRQERHAIQKVKAYVREYADQVITLAELSHLAGLSRFHLIRAFVRAVGMPPHRYQIRVRAERARVLLKAGLGIAQTAATTGFSDQSHLTRHFRGVFGITPGRFLKLQGRT